MTFENLPQELTDYILDFLHDDPGALRACSQTCRAWLPASHHHLFFHISLQSSHSCSAFGRLLEDAPHIGGLVHEIKVETPRSSKVSDSIIRPAVLDGPSPSSVYASLTVLQHLAMSTWGFDVINTNLVQHLHSVTRLTLHHCRFPTFHTFTELLHSFPKLDSLIIDDLTWMAEGLETHSISDLYVMPKPKELVIGMIMCLPLFVDWVTTEDIHTRLDRMSVRCSSESDVTAFSVLLSAVGESLRSLEVDWFCDKTRSTPAWPSDFTLNACSSISALTLRFPVFRGYRLLWVTSLLSLAASTAVQVINLEIRLLGDVDAIDWEAMRTILSPQSFRSLKKVNLKLSVWSTASLSSQDMILHIRDHLPELTTAGILCFVS